MIPSLAPHGAARVINWTRMLVVGGLALAGVSLLTGLGIWQLERRVWKLDLIQKVATRFAAPTRDLASGLPLDPAAHEYEHVALAGSYLPDLDTWVHASTDLGAGYWVLSPLRTERGAIVLVNRGFVPMDTPRSAVAPASGHAVVGVLRSSEQNGHWPRRNQPDQDRWYSRDVEAIGAARGLAAVTPFFVDATADATAAPLAGGATHGDGSASAPPPPGSVHPVAGLTVVHFRNAHLSYALTWFCLALMTAVAGGYALRGELRGTAQPR